MKSSQMENIISRLSYIQAILALIVIITFSFVGCGSSGSGSGEDVLEEGKLLIEHNATDEDTGFQGFADGEPWNDLTIKGPDGETILSIFTEGGLLDFGLTELFFETSEPENAEVPIENVLARLPEGAYTFTGEIVDANDSSVTASLTHRIPDGPIL